MTPDTLHVTRVGAGVRCRRSAELPSGCFCWDGVCSHAFTPLHQIMDQLSSAGQGLVVSIKNLLLAL